MIEQPDDFSNEDIANRNLAETVSILFVTIVMLLLFIKILFF